MNYNNPLYGQGIPWNINSGLGQNINTGANNNIQPNAFRNVFGILGGLQSLLHIFTSLLDLVYFFKALKSLVLDLILKILTKLFKILKYLFTLKWMFDFISKSNKLYGEFIYKSKYFKSFATVFKLSLVMSIIACLIVKYLKTSKLQSLKDDENQNNENNEKIEKENNEKIQLSSSYMFDDYVNITESEERWKNK